MPKLLLYANYFAPELAALAQIYTDLCRGLKDTHEITVICAIPCYTGAIEDRYLKAPYTFEEFEGIHVVRVKVPRFDKQNKWSRVRHISAYFWRSIGATFRIGPQDVVMASSQPPILGGLLGVVGKFVLGARMIYNIQDFNPEQIQAVRYAGNTALLRILMALDKFSCKRADLVAVVGEDMRQTLSERFARHPSVPQTAVIHNWIDESKIVPLPPEHEKVAAFRRRYGLEGKFVVMYSGNVGLFYDLDNLIEVMGAFPDDAVRFAIVGDGARKPHLVERCAEAGYHNVVFIPYQEQADLVYSLNAADLHWCVNAKGIKGVSCPSKLYGILAVGKPMIGVLESGTEARRIVETSGCGMVCAPGDYDAIAKLLSRMTASDMRQEVRKMGARGRTYLDMHLTKDDAIDRYRSAIEALTVRDCDATAQLQQQLL